MRTRTARRIATLIVAGWMLSAVGCARRAYTDVYVENMASEIRILEDQLYEFDSEYRVLEQELDALQAENARLRNVLPSGGAAGQSNLLSPQRNVPQTAAPQSPLLPVPGSGQGKPPSTAVPPSSSRKSVPGEPSPAPSLEGAPPAANRDAPQNPLSPSELPAPQSVPGANTQDPYDLKDLVPPTIEHGEAMPPTLPPVKSSDGSGPLTLNAPDEMELELGRISLPAQLASTEGTAAANGPARLPSAVEMPRDTRIVEVKFHPSLCRAVNLDGEGDDDGLSLVLQPLNAAGQFVPLSAELLVVAIDPSRDNSQRPPGRWNFAAEEVKAKLHPIGSSQGVHLNLPWNGTEPQADRLVVFVYYTLPDGRRVVAEQEIFLNNGHRQHTVWVPRVKAGTPRATVQTVSGQRPAK